VARCDSVLSCWRVRREYVSSLRRSGRSGDKTWLASFSILWKSLSSTSSTISEMSVWSAAQKPLRAPRLTKPVIRLRSADAEKFHQAVQRTAIYLSQRNDKQFVLQTDSSHEHAGQARSTVLMMLLLCRVLIELTRFDINVLFILISHKEDNTTFND